MDREKALDAATLILTGYAKRWMESNYDHLMATATGQAAQSLDKRIRYAIEAGLYGLLVVMDRELPNSSPVERLVRAVALDAPSEVAKRLVNGAMHSARMADGVQQQSVRNLLTLDHPEIASFLSWFGTLEPRERGPILHFIRDLKPGELSSFVALEPAAREQLLGAMRAETARSEGQSSASAPSPFHGLRAALERKAEGAVQKTRSRRHRK